MSASFWCEQFVLQDWLYCQRTILPEVRREHTNAVFPAKINQVITTIMTYASWNGNML